MLPFEGAAASLAAPDATLTPGKQRAAVAVDGRAAWQAASSSARLQSVAPNLWRRSSLAAGAGRISGCASYVQSASQLSFVRGMTAGRLRCWRAPGRDRAHPRRRLV